MWSARLCPFFRLNVGTADRTSFSVPFLRLNVGAGDRSKLLCTLKPRYGALHTRFDDYTPRNVRLPGLD